MKARCMYVIRPVDGWAGMSTACKKDVYVPGDAVCTSRMNTGAGEPRVDKKAL